ncbi:MAG: transporter substrate-binding domain-containing protein [Deltaproteobacteria bacterium]|nr:transporter substrate-binding domain-containing protein [Deltaproteobacteria bacterium]
MLTNRPIFIFLSVLLVVTATIIPLKAKEGSSGLSHHILKSATELDYPPFSMVKDDGTADGFSVDLLKAVTRAAGLDINFIVGPWNEIKHALINGRLDVLPLVSYSEERDKVLDFTAPYLQMHGTIFVRKGEKSIHSEADLKGREVLVMRGDTAHEYAVKKKLSDHLVLTDSFEQAMTLLSKGLHDAVIIQQVVGYQLIKKLNITNLVEISSLRESNLKPEGGPLSGFEQKFCIAVKEGNKDLLANLNEGLAIVIANGVYDKLYNKWFSPILPPPPVNLARLVKSILSILLPVLVLMGIAGIWYLRREVAGKTKYLRAEIKERKKAKKALKESEEKFKGLFEKAPLSYQSLDEKANFMEVNETWLETLGYKRNEVIGKNFSDFLLPEWKDSFSDNFSRLKSTGEILGVELEMVKKDGSTILVSFHGKSGNDQKSNIKRAHCVFHDITSQRVAQVFQNMELRLHKALAAISKELLSESYDIKAVSKVTLKYARQLTGSEHGFVSSIDKNTLENKGHTLTHMFGEQCKLQNKNVVFPIRHDGKYNALWGHALNMKKSFFSNKPESHPESKGLPQGHIPLENFMAVPVIMGESLIGLIALANSGRDYTDQDLRSVQRMSEIFALAIHRQEYEIKRIGLEQNLRQLQKIEAIGALAGGIAHDFNNILFPIVGFAEMLKEDLPKESGLRENVNEILAGAKRAKSLVQQILTFSRQAEQDIKPLKPHLIIKEVAKLIRSTIPTSIKIKKFIDPETRAILADPTQIHQIAMNLITNAYHAMQESGGVLTIRLQNIEGREIPRQGLNLGDGPHVLLSVKDTGSGMDKSILGKIFDPYFTTKPKGKGTGLGLSVIHGIVANYGGEINVNSSLGQGSKFDVYIPAIRENMVSKQHHGTENIPTGNERILLVDDEKQVLQIEQIILERLGYHVEFKNSSIDALEIIKNNPGSWDLIISDMTMPDMTGDKLAKKIMDIEPQLPVIICTGFSERVSLENIKSIGVKALLMKPIVRSELATTVRSVLDEAERK